MNTNMDHEFAEKTSAVERYLLGECDAEERASFEAHFFDCPECADQVQTGSIFVDNLRVLLREGRMEDYFFTNGVSRVRRDWFAWLRPAVLVPSFAALVMCVIIGYQNLVTLPALEQPQFLSTAVVAPTARDAGPVINVDRQRPMFNVNFAVDSPRVYPNYRCTFEKQQSGPPVLDLESGPRAVSSFTLSVLLPTSKFPDGPYVMTIRPVGATSEVIQRYTFTVHSGSI